LICILLGIFFLFYQSISHQLLEKEKLVDLIVMGSKSMGGFKGKLIGSVANSMVHHSKISVMIVR